MEKVYLKTQQEKSNYSYKVVTSIVIDEIMKEKYDLKISTPEIITVNFENKFDRTAMSAIHMISNQVSEAMPNEMPITQFNEKGFVDAKKIVYPIYKEVIEHNDISTIKSAVHADNIDRFEYFATTIRNAREREKEREEEREKSR